MYQDELYHHGIKGQKWGVRRYQNADGTLTEAGIKRYGNNGAKYLKAKREYRSAKRSLRRSKLSARTASYMMGIRNPMVVKQIGNVSNIGKQARVDKAKANYIRAKYVRDYETGRRKKLEGRYQPDVEDEVKYGRRDSVRIAKRRNKGMSKNKASRVPKAKRYAKDIAKVGISTFAFVDATFNNGRGTKKIIKAGIKGSIAMAKIISRGVRATKGVYNNYYNTSILDSSGKVITRYHDSTNYGEAIVRGLLNY